MAVALAAEALVDVVHEGLRAYVVPREYMVYVGG
jgi:hypothetical protein